MPAQTGTRLLSLASAFCSSLLFTACAGGPGTALRVATGATSHFICLGTFGAGIDPHTVAHETFGGIGGSGLLRWAMRHEVNHEAREVRARFLGGFEARAAWREGAGCRMLQDGETAPADTATLALGPALLPPIAGPDVVAPAKAAIAAALEQAFAEPPAAPLQRTHAVVVLHKGRVVAERYAPGYGVETRHPGNSISKSVTNALIGILVRDGRIAIDRPAAIVAWQGAGDPRGAITVEHLMRMRSGLALGDSNTASLASLWSVSNRMLFLARDQAGFAAAQPLKASPGADWTYSDGSYLILSALIRDAIGGGADGVRRFVVDELFGPLGMTRVTIGFDAAGTPGGSSSMLASARDWARFGQLYLQDGMVGERRILPEGWVAWSKRATPDAWIGYGAGFWTNEGDSFGAMHRRHLGLPADAFMARGIFGQFILMVPSADLVVARFGTTHGDQGMASVARLTVALIAALTDPAAPQTTATLPLTAAADRLGEAGRNPSEPRP